MQSAEFAHILAAILVLTGVASFASVIDGDWPALAQAFLFAVLIITITIAAKKITAYALDANVEHELWSISRYGFLPQHHLKTPLPAGILFPLIASIFSLGFIKLTTLLTYETRALKVRAAKRFGIFSYTEMTDWHNGLIGAAGIIAALAIAVVSYLLPMNAEPLAKLSIFYAFFNLLPLSNLDGTQIFLGSRVLWSVLAVITLIAMLYALVLV